MSELESRAPLAPSRLAENRETYERLMGRALRHARRGRYPFAAAWAELAAAHAWRCHPGLFADDRMEGLLADIGAATMDDRDPQWSERARSPASPQSVLHVLTEGFEIGGHTRLVWRWIEADRGRRHAVVLTRQRKQVRLPERLLLAPRASGGWVRALEWRRSLPLARARALRSLAMQFDLVVLHGHPFDVVPAIAFAGSGGPSVVVLNHAGFAFWVGRDVADAVACLRPSTCRLAKERRGIESTRLLVLPIPVEPPPTSPTRLEARRMLDVPADAVVLLTVANPSKYVPFEPGPSFMELVTSVSLRDERVRVLAVGPDDRGPWRAASERTEGRVRAFGTRDDPDLFARAADVYLDSFPVSSPTSFLDAGRHGVPIVSFCPHRERAPILCPDDPSPLGDLIVRVETPAAFAEALDGLVEDEAAREELGRSTAEAILSGHSLDAFGASLDDVYARAASLQGTARRSDQAVPAPGEIDDCLARMLDASGLSVSVSRLLTRHLESFPPRARPWLRLRIRAARQEVRG